MPLLAALGTLSYNGYSFDGTSKAKVNVVFVNDESGRTVLYHEHTIRVEAIVQDDNGADQDMESVRALLGEQGREFRFVNRGFGDNLIVNAGAGSLRDVRWGPKPKVIAWEPIGADKAAAIVWECVVCVPICDNTSLARTTGLMSFNYGVSFSVDNKGYTTRTISGHLLIAQTRNGRAIPDTADNYLNAYSAVPVPEGFKRSSSRSVSLDKSRLDFSIVDEQIPSPNAYPPGVVEITARHRAGWKRGSGLPRFVLTAEIEMDANWPPEHALVIFSAIANRRIAIAEAAVPNATSTNGGQSASPVNVLIDGFDVEEDIYTRRSSFSLSYRVPSTLAQFLFDGGLWDRMTGTWPTWHQSIPESQSILGHAEMQHLAAEDHITDMCADPTTNVSPTHLERGVIQNTQLLPIKNKKPSPDNSWLKYDHVVSMHRERPVSRQAILQTPDTDPGTFYPSDTSPMNYPPQGGTIDVIQEGGRSSYRARVSGQAIRAGYPIPRPKYGTIGSSVATEVGGDFHHAIVENWFGLPIYGAVWDIEYALEASPGTVEILPNPLEHLNGDGTASI